MKSIKFPFFLALLLLSFSGCTQKEVVLYDKYQELPQQEVVKTEEPKIDYELIYREAIAQSAMQYKNKRDGGDCSGFVNMINIKNSEPYYTGVELSKFYTNTNRSKAMYNLMKSDNRIVAISDPKVGDLVFFEDTLAGTKRKVGALNITHVGIVTQIDSDDTVHFIHHMNGKNVIDQLNIKFPSKEVVSGKIVNSQLKRCPKGSKAECLSSNLFSAFATPIVKTVELSQN